MHTQYSSKHLLATPSHLLACLSIPIDCDKAKLNNNEGTCRLFVGDGKREFQMCIEHLIYEETHHTITIYFLCVGAGVGVGACLHVCRYIGMNVCMIE